MKAALYCRLSEEDRNKPAGTCDSGSIQNQKTMLLQYAMEQEWDVFDIYSDDDYAGADRRRPQFNRLLRDAQQHPEDHQQLVVRIWGWSAYFVELDKEYQDHVLQRTEYTI